MAVRMEVLQDYYDVGRDDLLEAARRDPAHCSTYEFRRMVTHVAYTPDGAGFKPNAPGRATDDFGAAKDPSTDRRRRDNKRPSVEDDCTQESEATAKPKPKRQSRRPALAAVDQNKGTGHLEQRQINKLRLEAGGLRANLASSKERCQILQDKLGASDAVGRALKAECDRRLTNDDAEALYNRRLRAVCDEHTQRIREVEASATLRLQN